MPQQPTGVVTFVFTDIEGSSELWETHGPPLRAVIDEHNRIIRECITAWNGHEVSTAGDGFFLAFQRASDAVLFATQAQELLHAADWSSIVTGCPQIRVRVGIHSGEALETEQYMGRTVNRASRVCTAANGGQVFISDAARTLALSTLPEEIAFRDLGAHRLKGVGEEHLWQLCHPRLSTDDRAARSLDPRVHNLPLPPTPSIGRDEIVRSLRETIRKGGTRLLTILGPGGLGKSRAALDLAESLIGDYRDGVWWIDLVEPRGRDAMIQRIAADLRIDLLPRAPVREQLLAYLKDREILLVLDNTEQIPDAPDVINELLSECKGLVCVVTTRRRLDLRAEQVCELPHLPSSESELLFAERARARVSDFEVNEENQADVAELCERLEGLPLAIELAASRIAVLSPREMLERIDKRFRLLQSQVADIPVRQRALRATMDWSYDLLDPPHQSLFARLSVFAGGFTMEHAEAICEDDDLDPLEGVAELRRHSLLRAQIDSRAQRTRYQMLESVRDYAQEKLAALPDGGEEVRRAHAKYFTQFGEKRTDPVARASREPQAIAELTAELDNLRAAMRWTLEATEPGVLEMAHRLALTLHHVLHRRGFWAEARRRLSAVRETGGAGVPARIRATIDTRYASLAIDMGDLEEGKLVSESAVAAWKEIGDEGGLADALNVRGIAARGLFEPGGAEPYFREALTHLGPDDHQRRGTLLRNLANRAMERGDMDEANVLYEQALLDNRATGDGREIAKTLSNLGGLAQNAGRFADASKLYLEALNICRELDDRLTVAVLLNNLAEVADHDDDIDTALTLLLAAERIFLDLNSAYAAVPAATMQSLANRLPPPFWEAARQDAAARSWEQVVEELRS